VKFFFQTIDDTETPSLIVVALKFITRPPPTKGALWQSAASGEATTAKRFSSLPDLG
jgi:hypothetical protein